MSSEAGDLPMQKVWSVSSPLNRTTACTAHAKAHVTFTRAYSRMVPSVPLFLHIMYKICSLSNEMYSRVKEEGKWNMVY